MTTNMNKADALQEVGKGMYAKREAWDDCRLVRSATEGDREFINYDPQGIVVEDCKKRVCDCAIVIYRSTPEDDEAIDWITMTPEEAK